MDSAAGSGVGAACEAAAVTAEIPRPRGLVADRTWIAGEGEAQWHACEVVVGLAATSAHGACGRTVRGLRERSTGYDPPEQRHRSVCGPCLHAIGYLPPRAVLRRRLPRVTAAPDPRWPGTDPDTGQPATATALHARAEPAGSHPARTHPAELQPAA
ncbi:MULTISPECIES: hypothetical protein [unclassified Actinopolyspora]|uniref:hypothetical protein n=1 Tax=unclassified Actinopolyspora TaxID=2639451 RepID=UPI0013F5EF99|nr:MULTISPECIES: hypothetical protein [unclassified Actinopolyspora]NHD16301.1 hypothetical protein [Actinopolyspora sp. BKK2]NHE75836.1 hypothetical protein [Actinopolyspora sp. BKK1]